MNFIEDEKYCMQFSNEEIIEYLIKPLKKHYSLNIIVSSDEYEEILDYSREKIFDICFDKNNEDFHMMFYGSQTCIFILNEEFMFIDDVEKKNISGSDTYNNIVYEGNLREKTHKEILELMYEFIQLLIGTYKIVIEETVISQEGAEYPKCKYIVELFNDFGVKNKVEFENILFIINKKQL